MLDKAIKKFKIDIKELNKKMKNQLSFNFMGE